MIYPDEFSRHQPMTEPEMIAAVKMAVMLKLGSLGPVHWRKNTTLEMLVRSHGAEVFAREVAEQLILSNKVLFRGPPQRDHSIGYSGPPTDGT
jgi:hypothetical protein